MKYIPYGRQHITEDDIQAVVETLKSDYLTQGPKVIKFEKEFSKYVGAKYAVAVSNGTTALHLAAKVLGTRKGQRIITTPLSFVATANCIEYCEAFVDFVDIDPATLTLDIEKTRALIEAHPVGTFSGIIPVDFAGYPVDLEAFRKLADEHGLWLIEDACHAPGAQFMDSTGNWQKTGNGHFADLTIFSFHPVKHIACGEGGMITTNDHALYEQLQLLRTHGITKDPSKLTEQHGRWSYEMQRLGFNYRLADISCSLGISQLKRASAGLNRRRAIASKYDHAFKGLPITKIIPAWNSRHAYHLYIIQVEHRKELYNFLNDHGIGVQIHYPPIHLMPYYRAKGWKPGDFPAVEQYYDRCLSIPMYPTLTDEEQQVIISLIKAFINEKISHPTSTRRKQKTTA